MRSINNKTGNSPEAAQSNFIPLANTAVTANKTL